MTHRLLLSTSSKVILVCAVMLAGCAETNEHTYFPASTPVAAQPDIVSVKLAQAADKASRALDIMANIEQYKNPNMPKLQENFQNLPPNLGQPVTVKWSGPMEQIVYVLSGRAGYKMQVVGIVPEVPIVVNLDAYQQPLIHVMRDIGLQIGTRADLIINQQEGFVEVRYAAFDKSI